MIRTLCLLWLMALASLVWAEQDEDPRRWLDDMNGAFADLTYDGIFSYYSGAELATLRIVHMVVDGEQRERLVHMNGAPREILRRGEEIICRVEPDDALLALGDSIPTGPFAGAFVRSYNRISDYYGLSFFGDDRVADRPARRLAVLPRDEHRFGYRLWLDKETRLLLRSELIDVDGNRLEIFQFNHLRLGDAVDPADLEPEDRAGVQPHHLTLASKRAEPLGKQDVNWVPGWLPAGFALGAADVRLTPGSERAVSRMLYSDGLAAFSVFIEALPEPDVVPMESSNGATVAVTHLLEGAAGDAVGAYLVTVVGEIPTATARRIAAAIREQQ
jgi:sigma-E factor negative regulatory protein RseB